MTSSSYPVPLPRRSTTTSITTVRVAAAVQSIMTVGLFLFGGLIAAMGIGLAYDDSGFDAGTAARAALVGGLSALPSLFVGIPLLLLRAGRPAARTALVVAEAVTGPVLTTLSVTLRRGPVLTRVDGTLWVFLALTVVVLVALFRPSARAWAARPQG